MNSESVDITEQLLLNVVNAGNLANIQLVEKLNRQQIVLRNQKYELAMEKTRLDDIKEMLKIWCAKTAKNQTQKEDLEKIFQHKPNFPNVQVSDVKLFKPVELSMKLFGYEEKVAAASSTSNRPRKRKRKRADIVQESLLHASVLENDVELQETGNSTSVNEVQQSHGCNVPQVLTPINVMLPQQFLLPAVTRFARTTTTSNEVLTASVSREPNSCTSVPSSSSATGGLTTLLSNGRNSISSADPSGFPSRGLTPSNSVSTSASNGNEITATTTGVNTPPSIENSAYTLTEPTDRPRREPSTPSNLDSTNASKSYEITATTTSVATPFAIENNACALTEPTCLSTTTTQCNSDLANCDANDQTVLQTINKDDDVVACTTQTTSNLHQTDELSRIVEQLPDEQAHQDQDWRNTEGNLDDSVIPVAFGARTNKTTDGNVFERSKLYGPPEKEINVSKTTYEIPANPSSNVLHSITLDYQSPAHERSHPEGNIPATAMTEVLQTHSTAIPPEESSTHIDDPTADTLLASPWTSYFDTALEIPNYDVNEALHNLFE